MPLGAYIHIPFCDGKCPYCDFYSLKAGDRLKDRYTSALLSEIEKYSGETCDTIYIGGGTPLQLGEERLAKVLEKAVKTFGTPKEFTVEVNPAPNISKSFEALARCGVNRISMGMQSAVPEELSALGRRHSPDDVLRAVDGAHKCGIENISLDIMVGIPLQTAESLEYSADFAAKAGAAHISAYMLKIEPGTPFFDKKETLGAADDELSSELYLNLCESMAQKGYNQYEISNFAKNGF
ncbi:MAG: radical SAM family heme chaperone HemW, partial [Clostridia bacterium]|nr:radical SAM family heme chaperone HemW [Clostridia bacterium]